MQCQAKSKRSGQQCRAPAVRGMRVCRMHGGKTPRGYDLPQTTHGRYSKLLPLRLAQRYEEALSNKDLLSLRDDIAAVEARLGDLFQRVDTGESGQRWHELQAVLATFKAALAARDIAAVHGSVATMARLVTAANDDAAAWAEIRRTWETRCKLTATQARILVAAQQMVSTEQLMLYLGVITDAIQRAVATHADPGVARRILGDLSQEFSRISLQESRAEA